jgi:hypothetical protein
MVEYLLQLENPPMDIVDYVGVKLMTKMIHNHIICPSLSASPQNKSITKYIENDDSLFRCMHIAHCYIDDCISKISMKLIIEQRRCVAWMTIQEVNLYSIISHQMPLFIDKEMKTKEPFLL